MSRTGIRAGSSPADESRRWRTLLLGTPTKIDVEKVRAIFHTDGHVRCLEDFHLWELDTDYVAVLDDGEARVLAAAVRVGSTRLIDNVPLEGGKR